MANQNINVDGLEEVLNPIIASNLAVAHFINKQNQKDEEKCASEVIDTFTDYLDILNKTTAELKKKKS
jgi:hypothetical protein